MNKAIIRRAAVILTAVSLSAVPVFAKSNKNNMPGPNSENRYDDMPCNPGRGMGMGMGRFSEADSKQTMGTVSSVNKDTGMITVTDVDGKDTQIHVSPITRLMEEKNARPVEADFSDIEKGSWVMVAAFNTDTKILEAAHIFIANK